MAPPSISVTLGQFYMLSLVDLPDGQQWRIHRLNQEAMDGYQILNPNALAVALIEGVNRLAPHVTP